jgi:hypothetical protein
MIDARLGFAEAVVLSSGLLTAGTVILLCLFIALPPRVVDGGRLKLHLKMMVVCLALLAFLEGLERWQDYLEATDPEDVGSPYLEHLESVCADVVAKRMNSVEWRHPSFTEREVCWRWPELSVRAAFVKDLGSAQP